MADARRGICGHCASYGTTATRQVPCSVGLRFLVPSVAVIVAVMVEALHLRARTVVRASALLLTVMGAIVGRMGGRANLLAALLAQQDDDLFRRAEAVRAG